jgi:arylformamidase
MVSNTGTYIDSPFHRFADGLDLSEMPLASTTNLDTVVVTIQQGTRAIDADAFRDCDLQGKAVLVHTGWDAHWRTEVYFAGHPFLTARAAVYLAERQAALVGIDSFNIDDTEDGHRPVHTTLLGSGIPIVEHLRGLRDVPHRGARFFGAPLKVRACGTFPIRAYVLS